MLGVVSNNATVIIIVKTRLKNIITIFSGSFNKIYIVSNVCILIIIIMRIMSQAYIIYTPGHLIKRVEISRPAVLVC